MMDFKTIISQLEADRKVIEHLIQYINPDQAAWKPDRDRWSILEILNHIIDIEIEDFRHTFDLIIHTPEHDWPSFDEIEWITSRKYNERDLAISVKAFTEERNKSIQLLKGFSIPNLFQKHMGKGLQNMEMRAGDLLAAWVGHDLFHIKQLTLLKWDILKKWSDPFSPEYSGFE